MARIRYKVRKVYLTYREDGHDYPEEMQKWCYLYGKAGYHLLRMETFEIAPASNGGIAQLEALMIFEKAGH